MISSGCWPRNSGAKPVDEALDELALEGIVEIDEQRRARPMKSSSVRQMTRIGAQEQGSRRHFSMFHSAMGTRPGLISTPITLRKAVRLQKHEASLPAPVSTKL